MKDETGLPKDESLYQNGDSFEELFGKLQTMKGTSVKKKIKIMLYRTFHSHAIKKVIFILLNI